MKKICPVCNVEKNSKGFARHVKYCGNVAAKNIESNQPRDLPGLAATFGLMDALQREIEASSSIEECEEEKLNEGEIKCSCVDYDGQDYFCTAHKAKVECPMCHSVNVERKETYMEPMTTYRCGMCGGAYQRNMISGVYIYA